MASLREHLTSEHVDREMTRFLTEAGYFLYIIGKLDDAETALTGASASDPKDPVPLVALAETLLANGKAAKAERAARDACDLAAAQDHDAMPFAWLIRGDCQMALKKRDRAADTWRHAADLDPGGPVATVASDRLSMSGENAGATAPPREDT